MLLRRGTSSDALVSPRKKCAYVFFLKKKVKQQLRQVHSQLTLTWSWQKEVRWEETKEKKKQKKKPSVVLQVLNMPSRVLNHYWRSSNTGLNVDESSLPQSHMHEVYNQWCEKSKVLAVQRKTLSAVLPKQKLSILRPGKINVMCVFLEKKAAVQKKNIIYS